MNGATAGPEVSAAAAVSAVGAGAYLLDVRELDEWNAGHAPGATLIPLSELGGRLDEVPRDHEVLVICHSGMRSARATAALRDVGVDAVNVTGGMLAWRDADGELESNGDTSVSVG